MDKKLEGYIELLLRRYPRLACIRQELVDAYGLMEECYGKGGKLLVAGNGGSAADAGHMAGELMKKFRLARPVGEAFQKKLKEVDPVRGAALAGQLECPLTALPLVSQEVLATAYLNDVGAPGLFAQQLLGYGRPGDVFLGISTSGDSENVVNAAVVARASGIKAIGLTGAGGGELAKAVDVAVRVPETETYMVQELHLPVYHCWCMMLEERFFGG